MIGIIKMKADEIEAYAVEEINMAAERATERFKSVIETLKKQARISLPVNVLDIISKGGTVLSKEATVEYGGGSPLRIELETKDLFYEEYPHSSTRLKRGKYRITLIVEKLEG